jgi:hypothetical protein
MAFEPVKLKPSELMLLINSTSVGSVADRTRVFRHRQMAGFRISSDGRTVNLFKYLAWLVDQRHRPIVDSFTRDYEGMRESARQRNASLSVSGHDIGKLPEVNDTELKDRCRRNFRLFCESYFPLCYNLEFSEDHLRVIERIEQAVLHGGLFALAMPRGSGKSSLAETACIWAILYGHREFVTLIGSDESHALDMLESIKTELESNELLLSDFPEACFPINALEGISNRCSGQLYNGKRTQISWTSNEIVLPTIEGSAASGAIIRVSGITGRIRGMKFKRPDGKTVRPTPNVPNIEP